VRDYELMVVLDPNLDEAAIESLSTRVQSMVTQRGGTVENVDTWGRKRLAYPIGRHRDGFYILHRLQLPPTAAAEIERALKLTESVMRHLLVRSDGLASAPAQAHAPAPAQTSTPTPAPTPAPAQTETPTPQPAAAGAGE
jgi:small subunit ribosomal protein S6